MGKAHMFRYKYHNKRGKLAYGHLQSIETEAPFVLVCRDQSSQLWDHLCSSLDYYYVEAEKKIAIGRLGHSEVEIWATLKENFGDGDYGS